ncbi:hypothetical protein E2562_018265 [Oryza meyeriana var. granulata]|uniref:Uncharacterized protein n=1 Tax=Oryza meyeriana var. granulata TaxID=110450 RepID=A0A6G1CRZ5_9ORYZ|nr:hypothetical protein E2562_018265 [Oryza meyeriana var. granulata]
MKDPVDMKTPKLEQGKNKKSREALEAAKKHTDREVANLTKQLTVEYATHNPDLMEVTVPEAK